MLLVDDDVDQLEEYLDGALDVDSAAKVRNRIAHDVDWAQALDALRAERNLREKFWQSLEPDDDEVGQMVSRISHASRRRDGWAGTMRIAAAVAACVGISFFAGWRWSGRSNKDLATGIHPGVLQPQPIHSARFEVALTDDAGQVTAVQEFDSLEKAREFTADLNRWQDRQRHVRDGAAVIVADRF